MEGEVKVLERFFVIVELLAGSQKPLTLTEIAQSTKISKSTVHRLLTSMHKRHYVEKRADNSYRIGLKMLQAASYHINTLELLTESLPYLNALRETLNLTAHLGVLEGYEVVYVGLNDTSPNTKLYAQVGRRSPAYCSSIGKCLLSCLSGEELDEALSHCAFTPHTEKTIADPLSLRKHLILIRSQGWAMDNEEYKIGHRCVGASVFDYRGDSLAAISVSGSIEKISDLRLENITRTVRDCAAEISRSMGYSG